MRGLNPAIKDNLVSIVDRPSTLMGWENIIIQVDTNLHQRDLERKDESKHTKTKDTSKSHASSSTPTVPSTTTTSDVVPMEVDTTRLARGKLTQQEHAYRFKNNLCLYCGKSGHLVDVCFARKKKYPDTGKVKPESK